MATYLSELTTSAGRLTIRSAQDPLGDILRTMTTQRLLRELADRPESLHSLSPREFEEVTAELLAAFGWRVSLTKPTRDGGYDILGIAESLPGIEQSWLVECKRYAPDKVVGVEMVRQLIGVAHALQIPNTLLVTTARYSRGAVQTSATFPGVQLADFDLVSTWLRRYKDLAGAGAALPGRTFQSCFVSHSTRDADFVSQLVGALRSRGVAVWFAGEDLVPGKHLYEQIKQAIASFDRLLVVLSEASVSSTWVRGEIFEAFRRQQMEGQHVVFPISLIPFERLQAWSLIDPDTGLDLAREIRRYFVLDFSKWHDPSEFGRSIDRLIRALEGPRDVA